MKGTLAVWIRLFSRNVRLFLLSVITTDKRGGNEAADGMTGSRIVHPYRKENTMTGLVRSSVDLDERRRRILYRCWHRGIREMDLVLGQFAEENIADLTDVELDELEVIMDEEDNDLVKMVTGALPVPERFQTPLFERIASYRPDFDPVTN